MTTKMSKAEVFAGIDWWNACEEGQRRTMLTSPKVRSNPTPARCFVIFGGLREFRDNNMELSDKL